MTRALLPLSAAVLLALSLTACAADPAPAPTDTPAVQEPAATNSPEPTEEPDEEEPEPVALSCETLIPEDLVVTFTSTGAKVREEPVVVAGTELEDGLLCRWGAFGSGDAGGGQTYGWAPIDETTATDAIDTLESEGWIRLDSDGRLFVTENPNTIVVADEDGYGMTYEFGEDWVTVSDTKQGLDLILQPR